MNSPYPYEISFGPVLPVMPQREIYRDYNHLTSLVSVNKNLAETPVD